MTPPALPLGVPVGLLYMHIYLAIVLCASPRWGKIRSVFVLFDRQTKQMPSFPYRTNYVKQWYCAGLEETRSGLHNHAVRGVP